MKRFFDWLMARLFPERSQRPKPTIWRVDREGVVILPSRRVVVKAKGQHP